MNDKIFGKFIKLLAGQCDRLEWNGWERRLFFGGCFCAYQAYLKGCIIKITHYDCTGARFTASRVDARWMRGLKAEDVEWIEVEATDLITRFGRRAILQPMLVLPGSPNSQSVFDLFERIKGIGRIFTVAEERLSQEQALLGFCKQIGTHET